MKRRSVAFGHASSVLFIFGVALGSACDDGERLSAVGPEIFGDPPIGTPLNFEEAVLGQTSTSRRVLRIGNRGLALLVLQDIRVEGPGADHFRLGLRPQTIAPGQFGSLDIRFAPTTAAEHSAQLVVDSNDVRQSEAIWPLHGAARNPCRIEASPSFQNFLLGEVRTVTVQASADHRCEITNIQTDRALFAVIDEPPLPYEIPAGQSATFDVQHVAIGVQPSGTPTRELVFREREGTEAKVVLAGVPPVVGCLRASRKTSSRVGVPLG
ncbi:MAG: choice-of-anchor D domain-containing protein [Myxococcota bacterium]